MHSQLATLVFLLASGFYSLGVHGWTNSQSLSRHRAVRHHVERALHHPNTHSHNLTKRGGNKKGYCSSQKNVQVDAGISIASHATTTWTTSSAYPTPHHGKPSDGGSQPDGSSQANGSSHANGSSQSDGGSQSDGSSQPYGGSQPDSGSSSGSSETFDGDATYYGIGLGACGWTNSEPDMIAAVSHALFDSFATTAAAKDNPNLNPICGKMAHATIGGLGSVLVKIVDRCGGCDRTGSLDFSMAAFNTLTDNGQAVGRYTNMTWHFA